LSDGLFDTMVDRFTVCPSPMSAILLEHFHGEVCRVPLDATAVQAWIEAGQARAPQQVPANPERADLSDERSMSQHR